MSAAEEEKKDQREDKPIPVTILSGFLGSGKTTLLKYVLQSIEHKLKVAVIVNDLAELNIDASLVRQPTETSERTASVVQTQREIISLQNGCIWYVILLVLKCDAKLSEIY